MKRERSVATGAIGSIHLQREGVMPLYEQLAEALAESIRQGMLSEGDRLPSHRDLARELDINITTVTKAIARLKTMGLVESRAGRGTTVGAPYRESESRFQSAPSADSDIIDLSVNRSPTDAYLHVLQELLPKLPQDQRFGVVDDYQRAEGPEWVRQAVAQWLAEFGVPVDHDALVITEGAQHALASVLRAVVRPGDTMLADAVTYQGVNALARTLGVELHGVRRDDRGMCPEALDRACEQYDVSLLFLVPCLHNPTTLTLDDERRQALVDVARKHNLLIIEDDVYRPLLSQPPKPLVALAPERTFYVAGFSKSVAPGLRFGYVAAPPDYVQDIAAAVRVDCWSIPPLSALIATRLIESGDAVDIVTAHREALQARHATLMRLLGGYKLYSNPASTHAWLCLPAPWRGSDFARIAHEQGVEVLPAAAFTLRDELPPHAVRINLAAARSRLELERGLTVLAELVRSGHRHVHGTV